MTRPDLTTDQILDNWHAERQARKAMRRHNRPLLAERLGWPAGVVQACDRLDDTFRDWSAGWLPASAWSGRPAGFTAEYILRGSVRVWGATAEEVAAAIRADPAPSAIRPITPLPRTVG